MRFFVAREWREAALLFVALLCLVSTATAQRKRPQLLVSPDAQRAGRIVLIPADARPDSFHQPRMLAALIDHELVTPPPRALGDDAATLLWANELDYSNVKGAVVALPASPQRAALIGAIQKAQPSLPVYSFDAVAPARTEPPAVADPSTPSAVTANRNATEAEPGAAAMTLLARLAVDQFRFRPRFLPLYSSATGRAGVHRAISERIKLIGGEELTAINDAARASGILLFIHTRQTTVEERDLLIDSLQKALEKSYRVAVLDLSESAATKQMLLAELRSLKLLDKIFSYASAEAEAGFHEATTRVLSHCAVLTVGLRFLRTDVDRVHRIDRAHIALLLSRYLTDYFYAHEVREKVEAFVRVQLKADPARLGEFVDRVETYAASELKPLAETLFNEQFRDNLHAILLNSGDRAQFSLRFLQLLQLRLPANNISEVEIRPSAHLVYVGNIEKPTP